MVRENRKVKKYCVLVIKHEILRGVGKWNFCVMAWNLVTNLFSIELAFKTCQRGWKESTIYNNVSHFNDLLSPL